MARVLSARLRPDLWQLLVADPGDRGILDAEAKPAPAAGA
jgi:hypothetical protein